MGELIMANFKKELAELTEQERKERTRLLHAANVRKHREKETLWAYKMLVKAVLDLSTTDNLSVEEIALKIANNGQFRLFIAKKDKKSEKTAK